MYKASHTSIEYAPEPKYRKLLEQPMAPLCIIAGTNHLLEVTYDYAIRQETGICNPAGILSNEYTQQAHRKLPDSQYPLIVTQFTPTHLDNYPLILFVLSSLT